MLEMLISISIQTKKTYQQFFFFFNYLFYQYVERHPQMLLHLKSTNVATLEKMT